MKTSQDRQKLAVELIERPFQSALDLGCGREKPLKEYLGNVEYLGVDFIKGEGIKNWNLENGLPFLKDKSFDAVFAIEVLEHLENIHFLCREMERVAKNEIVLSFPNMNHWIFRLKHLLGKPSLNHCRFLAEKTEDRHRWFPTHAAAREFVKANFPNKKIKEAGAIYPYKKMKFLGKIDSFLANFFPGLFVYTSFFHLDLNS